MFYLTIDDSYILSSKQSDLITFTFKLIPIMKFYMDLTDKNGWSHEVIRRPLLNDVIKQLNCKPEMLLLSETDGPQKLPTLMEKIPVLHLSTLNYDLRYVSADINYYFSMPDKYMSVVNVLEQSYSAHSVSSNDDIFSLLDQIWPIATQEALPVVQEPETQVRPNSAASISVKENAEPAPTIISSRTLHSTNPLTQSDKDLFRAEQS